MEILDNKVLLFRTRHPEKYSVIPKAAVVGEKDGIYEMAVKWGFDECRLLKNLGVKSVPSTIKRDYGWPGIFAPMQHQVETAAFLTLHQKAFCFSEPGTGKTSACLWAADYLMQRGLVRRVLVLCPLSIMSSAWQDEIFKTIMHRSAVVAYHSNAEKRREAVRGGYEFVISNYDGLAIISREIVDSGEFDLIIVDEANFYKTTKTQRWKTLHAIVKSSTRLWMLTGTPAPQSPVDAYGLAKLVNPEGVPRYVTAWRESVMQKVATFRYVPKQDAAQKVFAALQPAIRYTKEQCTDLPPVLTVTRQIQMTPQQDKYYKEMKREQLMRASGEIVTAANAAIAINKLLQISSGAVYTDDKMVIEFDCAPRLNALLEVIEDTDRKVIIFVPYRHAIETISAQLTKENIPNAAIYGAVSLSERTRIFEAFQDVNNPLRACIIQPQAAAHGVTLTAADTVVFWGPVTSVETYIQCIARADRVGQNANKVTVIHLQASEVERKLYKQLASNIMAHDAITKLYEEEFS